MFNILLFSIISFGSISYSQDKKSLHFTEEFEINLKNPIDENRIDEPIELNVSLIMEKYSSFNPKYFIVIDGSNEVASQVEDTNRDTALDKITFLINFSPNEAKTVKVQYNPKGILKRDYEKRTQAELSKKVDYVMVNGKYTKGRFENIDYIRVPDGHVDHDALFRYEGPGWESDKIGYRFYLDPRNRVDIFGKKVKDMVLHHIGTNDLEASDDSYHTMQWWGMDVFKVGKSLGIGSLAMSEKANLVGLEKTDSVICFIASNGHLRSEVETNYFGWSVGVNKYNLEVSHSIIAGSRLTKVEIIIDPVPLNLATGLAKHEKAQVVESAIDSEGDWRYVGLYGNQSFANDNLGIALFYKSSELIERTEDNLNYIVILKPENGKTGYYFAAAWQQEPAGITDLANFKIYLDNTTKLLNNPIDITIK